MKVILTKDHPQLGPEGTVLEVAAGYARNFLIPQRLARLASRHHIRLFEQAQEKKKRRAEKQLRDAQELAKKLSGVSCTIAVAAGDEDRLFGSVTAADIAEVLVREGFAVDKKQVELDEPIKKLGIYSLTVKLAPEISAPVKVWVVKE